MSSFFTLKYLQPILLSLLIYRCESQVWTWQSGDTATDSIGYYGIQRESSSTNIPPARNGATGGVDSKGNIWIFGGEDGIISNREFYNDLWKYDGKQNWTWISGSIYINEYGTYGTQGICSSANTPGARTYALSWIDSKDQFWLFGGYGLTASSYGYLNDLWLYNGTCWTWISGSNTTNPTGNYGEKGVISPSNQPPPRDTLAGWIDSQDHLWFFGGYVYPKGTYTDVWEFNGQDWTWIAGSNLTNQLGIYGTKGISSPSNMPGSRNNHAIWNNKSSGIVWVFGGYGYGNTATASGGDLNDLWIFNTTDLNWTWISGGQTINQNGEYGTQGIPSPTNVPGSRQQTVGWLGNDNRIWIFGGLTPGAVYLNDLWQFDGSNWTWTSGSSAGNENGIYGTEGIGNTSNIAGSRELQVSWKGPNGTFWIFGGYGFAAEGSTGLLNDVWSFDSRCIAGSYSLTGGTAPCIPCPITTYSPTIGADTDTSCISCPAGTFSNKTGASYCESCSAGSYSKSGSKQCTLCPAGTNSVAGSAKCQNNVSTSGSGSSDVGLIVGIVLGILACFFLTGFTVLYLKRRKRREAIRDGNATMNTYDLQMYTCNYTGFSDPTNNQAVQRVNSGISDAYLEKEQNALLHDNAVDTGSSWNIPYQSIQIIKELGRGGYGIVYKALWRKQEVAVKKIASNDPVQLEEFRKEFSLMNKLRPHKHVVQLLGMVQKPLCIVLDYYPNGNLHNFLHTEVQIPFQLKMKILKGITSGMLHLHAEGIIHRDLAARNVLLTENYEAVVADFGYSRTVGTEEVATTRSDVGPVKWMAIENFTTRQYSKKSDVWSFGVTAWEVITRKDPWDTLDTFQVAFAIRDGQRLVIPENACPKQIADLIRSCWEINPNDRPDFESIWNELNSLPSPVSRSPPINRLHNARTGNEIVRNINAAIRNNTDNQSGKSSENVDTRIPNRSNTAPTGSEHIRNDGNAKDIDDVPNRSVSPMRTYNRNYGNMNNSNEAIDNVNSQISNRSNTSNTGYVRNYGNANSSTGSVAGVPNRSVSPMRTNNRNYGNANSSTGSVAGVPNRSVSPMRTNNQNYGNANSSTGSVVGVPNRSVSPMRTYNRNYGNTNNSTGDVPNFSYNSPSRNPNREIIRTPNVAGINPNMN